MPMKGRMQVQDLVFVQGMKDTRRTLRRWNRSPLRVVGPWVLGSVAVTVVLLCAVWVVALVTTPDPFGASYPGINVPADAGATIHVLVRNGLVLSLHALACVAGFIAGSSLPLTAQHMEDGLWRKVHDHAGPLAIGFVACATLFSLFTQAYALGGGASDLAASLGISPGLLIVGLLPHALPELVALFLPLAAWTIASRRGDWHELLAATVVTTAIAVPVLVVTSLVEVYVTPDILRWIAGV
jgi:hypothetical protein